MDQRLRRSNPDVKRLLTITFPNYQGRTIRLSYTERMRLENYWDGGTRSKYVAVNLNTGATSTPAAATANPFNAQAHQTFEMPLGVAVVEHSIFCGKDAGIIVHVRRESVTMLSGFHPTLPAAHLALTAGA